MFDEALEAVKSLITDYGLEATLVTTKEPISVLSVLVTLEKDEVNRDKYASILFLPTDDEIISESVLLQIFTQSPFEVKESIAIHQFAAFINGKLPVGFFYLDKQYINFRCVVPIPISTSSSIEAFGEIFKLSVTLIDIYMPFFEKISLKNLSAAEVIVETGLS